MKRMVPAAMVLALLTSACGSGPKPVAAAPADGMTWESIQRLPDFSGWWIWDYIATHDSAVGGMAGLPYKPEIQEKANQELQQFLPVFMRAAASDANLEEGLKFQSLNAQDYCRPPGFFGVSSGRGGLEGSLEFLFTPGRVTILDESGMIRRIALNRLLPPEIADSRVGTSVGHWEGQSLVIETGFNDEQAIPGARFAGKIGRNARSLERIWLKEQGVLQIDLTLTVPELFAKSYEHTYIFRRDPEHEFAEYSICSSHDRSVDPVTHMDRFDATPPPGLPPPPSN